MSFRVVSWLVLPLWSLLDYLLPKRSTKWAFFMHPIKVDQFVENSRAVFEEVKSDPAIQKYVFTRGGSIDLGATEATRLIPLQSLLGLWMLSRCGVYYLTNTVAMDMSWRWKDGSFAVLRPAMTRRHVVNLWHGIPLKRLFALTGSEALERSDRAPFRRKERSQYRGLVASSDIDSYAMAGIFYPIAYSRVWITGLPRNDFLRKAEIALPASLIGQLQDIQRLKRGRRLITYAPTFRDLNVSGGYYYQFTALDMQSLRTLLERHNAVLGFRGHYFRQARQQFNVPDFFDGDRIVDLGHEKFSEIAAVLRASDIVVTDYSSVFIDALYLNLPVFSFAYDREHYERKDNGFLYEPELVFPAGICETVEQLLSELDHELRTPSQVQSGRYDFCRKLFFKYFDDQNSRRLVGLVKSLMNGDNV